MIASGSDDGTFSIRDLRQIKVKNYTSVSLLCDLVNRLAKCTFYILPRFGWFNGVSAMSCAYFSCEESILLVYW